MAKKKKGVNQQDTRMEEGEEGEEEEGEEEEEEEEEKERENDEGREEDLDVLVEGDCEKMEEH
jgi:hypothetical protein